MKLYIMRNGMWVKVFELRKLDAYDWLVLLMVAALAGIIWTQWRHV